MLTDCPSLSTVHSIRWRHDRTVSFLAVEAGIVPVLTLIPFTGVALLF